MPNRIRTLVLCLPLGLLTGCGGGADGTPVAPTPTPAPTPAPPPAPPTLRALIWGSSAPSAPTGYAAGERIVLVATFQQTTTVTGNPRLAIQIGERLRLADFSPWVEDDFPPERPSFNQRFAYEVTSDDLDADGISVSADAFDFSEGALLNEAGVEIEVEIHAIAPEWEAPDPVGPGEALDAHRVMGTVPLRACTDQRERALNYSWGHATLVHEWHPDRPIRFRIEAEPMIAGGPRIGRPNFLEEQILQPLRDAARRLKERLGYTVMESPDAGPGRADHTVTVEWRDRVWSPGWGSRCPDHVGSPMNAQLDPPGAILNRYFFDPAITCYEGIRDAETVIHELAHVFGMGHSEGVIYFVPEDLAMSPALTRLRGGESDKFLLVEDLDNIGCVFPHPDFPR